MNGKLGRKAAIETSPDRPATLPVRPDGIAELLRRLPRWLVWRWERSGDRWSKVPYQALDPATHAKSTDPATWGTFEQALTSHREGRADGVGFVLSRPTASRPDLPDDNLACVDLDDIRTEAGTLTEEADEIVSRLASYAEVSPTSTGVKVILRGDKPAGRCKFPEAEVYTSARYLALTGWHLNDTPSEPMEAGEALRALHGEWEARLARARPPAPTIAPAPARAQRRGGPSVEERAVAYLNRCPPAVSGCDGHGTTLSVARAVVWGFDLGAERGYQLLEAHYNGRCQPPWSERDLRHKCEEADRVTFGKARGWLLNEEREPPARHQANGRAPGPAPQSGPAEPEPEAEPTGYRWDDAIDADTFLATTYETEWLVERFLVAGQPGVIGGPQKVLKTSIGLDLAISLALAESFLGEFKVYKPRRVRFISGESGKATINETVHRIIRDREIDAAGLGRWLSLQFTLPRLASQADMREISEGVRRDGIDVLFIDPLYLTLLTGNSEVNPANLYAMGSLFRNIAGALDGTGCTLLLMHHATKPASREHGPLDLANLAYSGIGEFTRQWVLLNRREAFLPDEPHKLWLGAGGSAGQSGLWSLDIEEGQPPDRTWFVDIKTAGAEFARRKEASKADRESRKARTHAEEEDKFMRALDKLDPEGKGVSLTQVSDGAPLSHGKGKAAKTRLVVRGLVEEVPGFKAETGNGGLRAAVGVRRRVG